MQTCCGDADCDGGELQCGALADQLFQYNGGRLLSAALPDFMPSVAAMFTGLAAAGSDLDLAFILDTMPNYRGNAAILPVLMAVADRLSLADAGLEKVEFCLQTTGVVTRAFGFVEAYRAKKATLQPWLADSRPGVRAFAADCIRRLDLRIADEQRRAEQRKEQRRLDFDGTDGAA